MLLFNVHAIAELITKLTHHKFQLDKTKNIILSKENNIRNLICFKCEGLIIISYTRYGNDYNVIFKESNGNNNIKHILKGSEFGCLRPVLTSGEWAISTPVMCKKVRIMG